MNRAKQRSIQEAIPLKFDKCLSLHLVYQVMWAKTSSNVQFKIIHTAETQM